MVIVPNLCGFATFSPRLDESGNSVRGTAFFRKLVDRFTIHAFDNYSAGLNGYKFELSPGRTTQRVPPESSLGWAAAHGDLTARSFQRLFLKLSVGVSSAIEVPHDLAVQQLQRSYYDCVGGLLSRAELGELRNGAPSDALTHLIEEINSLRLIFPREITEIFVRGIRGQVHQGTLVDPGLQQALLQLLEAVGVSPLIGKSLLREWEHVNSDQADSHSSRDAPLPDSQVSDGPIRVIEAREVSLSDEAAKLEMQRIWKLARVEGPRFARLAYSQLFWEDAAVAALFKGTAMEAQGERLVAMIDQAMALLGDSERLSRVLRDLGAHHTGLGVLDEHYASVGDALTWAMKKSAGEARWAPESDAALKWFYGFVSREMLLGAEVGRTK
jgi:nitric oxide dioxygenase